MAAVHGEFFRDIRPVNTIMQVTRFIDPAWLVEVEADAVVDDASGGAYPQMAAGGRSRSQTGGPHVD